MDLSPKALLQIAQDYGWVFRRISGSHHIYKNPKTGVSVPIPIHGNKDLKLGTFKAIEKILKR
jgi:predicted RNA binding protein YcfA (HicA-like mRNA interferase family)